MLCHIMHAPQAIAQRAAAHSLEDRRTHHGVQEEYQDLRDIEQARAQVSALPIGLEQCGFHLVCTYVTAHHAKTRTATRNSHPQY